MSLLGVEPQQGPPVCACIHDHSHEEHRKTGQGWDGTLTVQPCAFSLGVQLPFPRATRIGCHTGEDSPAQLLLQYGDYTYTWGLSWRWLSGTVDQSVSPALKKYQRKPAQGRKEIVTSQPLVLLFMGPC